MISNPRHLFIVSALADIIDNASEEDRRRLARDIEDYATLFPRSFRELDESPVPFTQALLHMLVDHSGAEPYTYLNRSKPARGWS